MELIGSGGKMNWKLTTLIIASLLVIVGGIIFLNQEKANLVNKNIEKELSKGVLKYSYYGENIGYETLENNIIHFWNNQDSYYLDIDSGIQFTNHYNEYWTKNIFCAGYKTSQWNYLCNDELPIELTLYSDNLTYVEINGTRIINIAGRDIGMGISYRLENNDNELDITVGLKHLSGASISTDLAFAWKTKDIQIDGNIEEDRIFVNNTWYNLNENLDLLFKNMSRKLTNDNYTWNGECDYFCYTNPENESCVFEDCFDVEEIVTIKHDPFYILKDESFVKLRWNENLNYFLQVKNTSTQNTVTLAIVTTGLNPGQTKKTSFQWRDPSGLSDTFTDDDNTFLQDHTADGVTWTITTETVPNTVYISSNAIFNSAFRASFWFSDSTETCSEITMLADTTDGIEVNPGVLMGSGDRGYSIYLDNSGGDNYTSVIWEEGTAWRKTVSGLQYPVDEDHVIRIVVSKTNPKLVSAYVDGDFIGFYSDTSPDTTGNSGFGAGTSGSASGISADDWNDCYSAPCVDGFCTFDYKYLLEDQNICESEVGCQGDVGTLIKWGGIAEAIPLGVTITSANVTFWINDVDGSPDNDIVIRRTVNQTWVEGQIPTGTKTNATVSTLNSTSDETYTTMDATNIVSYSYNLGEANLSMEFEDPDNPVQEVTTTVTDNLEIGDNFFSGDVGIIFDSSRKGDVNKRPTLTISYTSIEVPIVVLDSPLHNTISTNTSYNFKCNVTDNLNISNTTLYIWNGEGIFNTTLNTSTGTSLNYIFPVSDFSVDEYTWNCLSYDNDSQSAWAPSNFSLEVIAPDIEIVELNPEISNYSYHFLRDNETLLFNITNCTGGNTFNWTVDNESVSSERSFIMNGSEYEHSLYHVLGYCSNVSTSMAVSTNLFPVDVGNKNDFTIVVLPDTQYYSETYPHIFDNQTKWVVETKDEFNTKFVIHLGDLVNSGESSAAQWENANDSMSLMDGEVPYALTIGNHDYDEQAQTTSRNSTFFDSYFNISRYNSESWWGGSMNTSSVINSYQLFNTTNLEGNIIEWMILNLEFCPRNESIAWANNTLNNNPNKKVIYFTHTYLYADNLHVSNQPNNCTDYGFEDMNNGDAQWEKLVKNNSNIDLVASGHHLSDGIGYRTDNQPNGGKVDQFFTNFQTGVTGSTNGGNGFLRIVRFSPYDNEIIFTTYSPQVDSLTEISFNQMRIEHFFGDGIADIALENPEDDESVSSRNITFKATITANDSLQNVSLYHDLNGTFQKNTTFILEYGSNGADSDYINMTDNILLFHFDNSSLDGESNSLVYDFSGNNNNGTPVNGAAPSLEGKRLGSYSFDGTNDYINVSNNNILNNSGNGWSTGLSITFWVKTTDPSPSNDYILSKDAVGVNTGDASIIYRHFGECTGAISFWNQQPNKCASGNTEIANDTWYFYAFILDSDNTMNVYENGYLHESVTNFGTFWNNNVPIQVGSVGDGNTLFSFKGNMDELEITNRTILREEVMRRYELGKGVYYLTDINNDTADGKYKWNVKATNVNNDYSFAETNSTFYIGSSVIILDPTEESPVSVNESDNITISFQVYDFGTEIISGVDTINASIGGTDCTSLASTSYSDNSWKVNCTVPGGFGGLQDLTIWVNHSSLGDLSNTEINAVNYVAADTCTYSGSGNWFIECSDNCIVSSPVTIIGGALILSGPGSFSLNAPVNGMNYIFKDRRCRTSKLNNFMMFW